MTPHAREAVHRWLDEATASMGGDAARRNDVLRELEATIYDRVDELESEGRREEEAVRLVLDSMGDAVKVGGAFSTERALLAPHHTRPFLLNTAAVFAAHFLLVIGATVAGRALGFSFLRVAPITEPRSFLALFTRALETALFDAGAVLCLFAFLPRLARLLRFPRADLAVRPDARRCLGGALFLGLVLAVANFFRDGLLALYVVDSGGAHAVPLVGPGFLDNLPFLNAWLLVAIARDVLYARLGERRLTLATDLLAGAAGLLCLLRLVAAERLVDLSGAHDALGTAADGLAALLNAAFSLIALAAAALLAVRAVRRGFRLVLLSGHE
ncbi:MAG: permease prefix domain 1-containing protein [Planctomycetota bacterium]